MRVLILIVVFISLGFSFRNPPLLLECHYDRHPKFEQRLKEIAEDREISKIYDMTIVKDTINITVIKDLKSGIVLGSLVGVPTKEFLLKLRNESLTHSYINLIRRKHAQ